MKPNPDFLRWLVILLLLVSLPSCVNVSTQRISGNPAPRLSSLLVGKWEVVERGVLGVMSNAGWQGELSKEPTTPKEASAALGKIFVQFNEVDAALGKMEMRVQTEEVFKEANNQTRTIYVRRLDGVGSEIILSEAQKDRLDNISFNPVWIASLGPRVVVAYQPNGDKLKHLVSTSQIAGSIEEVKAKEDSATKADDHGKTVHVTLKEITADNMKLMRENGVFDQGAPLVLVRID